MFTQSLSERSRRGTGNVAVGNCHGAKSVAQRYADRLNKEEDGQEHHCCQNDWQAEELTEHTGVHRQGLLAKVTTAVMLDALHAGVGSSSALLVNVERRQQKHWHKHCQ